MPCIFSGFRLSNISSLEAFITFIVSASNFDVFFILGPKGEKVLGIDDEGFLKPVSRLLDKDEAARNEQISKGGPRPGK